MKNSLTCLLVCRNLVMLWSDYGTLYVSLFFLFLAPDKIDFIVKNKAFNMVIMRAYFERKNTLFTESIEGFFFRCL